MPCPGSYGKDNYEDTKQLRQRNYARKGSRMKKTNKILQSSEWIIMEKLWEESPKTITQLYHALKEQPGWSKSTVNTLLGRMAAKGILHYEEGGKARQYYPDINREEASMAETESLLERVYQGSVSMMMNTLVREKGLSREEIAQLQELLHGLEEHNTASF